MTQKTLYSQPEAVRWLSTEIGLPISDGTFGRIVSRGELSYRIIGARRFFHVDDLRSYVERCRQPLKMAA